VVETELGGPPEEVFAHFDLRPLASASIGQVHAATLRGGEEAAVKIQRPGIRARLEGDLRILHRIARILERRSMAWRMANPVAVVEDFASSLTDELNFVVAGQSAERFAANLRSSGKHPDVRVPAVHWDLTTPRVMTMERIRGHSLDDLQQLRAAGWDLAEALKKGVRAWVEAVFEHGFFHGDVHAGNLMVDDRGNVVMLDFGIVGRLQPATRDALRLALPALMFSDDYGSVASTLFELEGPADPAAVGRAAADMARIIKPLMQKPLGEISYGEVLVDVVRIGTRHHVRLPRQLVLVAKQLLYFERYAKKMAPGWNVLADPEVLASVTGTA
jgi:predicted unusual protein kinase regulating ubiquinone biosynthesis (AarF/ABC1/UbiB family)